MYSPLLKKLIDNLRILPGVGPKTAQRMAFHILQKTKRHQANQLAKILADAVANIKNCNVCRTYCETEICEICSSNKRLATTLCIVESPQDIIAIEQTSNYQGKYFVLHGRLSPLDGIGPYDIGLDILFNQLKTTNNITEIIIATNSTVEGEATAHYISRQASTLNITCSRIAHGVPMGGELEYLDGNTLSYALQARVIIPKQQET